jgi:hypothetical protein
MLLSTAKPFFHAVLADIKSWKVLTTPHYYSLCHCHTVARENLGFRVNGSETLDPTTGSHVSTFSDYHWYSHLGDKQISQPNAKIFGT